MTSVSSIKSHRLDVPQQNDSNQEEVLDEQQLLNQERNFVFQVGADCSQMKEEQEDVFISQEGEQFGLKQETQTFDEGMFGGRLVIGHPQRHGSSSTPPQAPRTWRCRLLGHMPPCPRCDPVDEYRRLLDPDPRHTRPINV
ncbi:uncharacterized protein KZ484_017163 isoform 2-T2 [Pholidichthys leucotaenia]